MSNIMVAAGGNNNNRNGNDDMLQIMQMATMNISNLGKQMGVISEQLTHFDTRLSGIENRMQKYEDSTLANRDMCRRIKNAIHARVNKLLGIEYRDGLVTPESMYSDKYYRGGFISRCYADARKYSRLGTPYYTTLARDVEETISYIENWFPEISYDGLTGVEAYKRYLDARRAA